MILSRISIRSFIFCLFQLNLVTNETDKPLFQTKTQLYSQNTTLVLRDFKPNQVYRFYCVRVSDKGLYTRSVDITCANGIIDHDVLNEKRNEFY